MNHLDTPFPIALRKRPRRRPYLVAALASLPLLGVLPVLGIAQASRQSPAPARTTSTDAAALTHHQPVDRPATVTLGALIEAQRRARAERHAMATVEQQAAALPPGEAWQAQLGAFSSADAAERQRGRLIGAGVRAVIRHEGTLHRLQSLPALRTETEGLCARALASGIDCFVRQATTA